MTNSTPFITLSAHIHTKWDRSRVYLRHRNRRTLLYEWFPLQCHKLHYTNVGLHSVTMAITWQLLIISIEPSKVFSRTYTVNCLSHLLFFRKSALKELVVWLICSRSIKKGETLTSLCISNFIKSNEQMINHVYTYVCIHSCQTYISDWSFFLRGKNISYEMKIRYSIVYNILTHIHTTMNSKITSTHIVPVSFHMKFTRIMIVGSRAPIALFMYFFFRYDR